MGSMTISGLASGLDTESIIKQLMDLERMPLARLQMRQNTLQVEKNAWQDIYSRLSSLNNKIFDLTLSSTFTSLTATSSDPSVLTAQAKEGAALGSYQIVVEKLAQAEVVKSNQIEPTARLTGSLTISTSSGSKDLNVDGMTLDEVKTAINNAKIGVRADIIDKRLVLTALNTGSVDGDITYTDSAGLGLVTVSGPQDAFFSVNGIEIQRQSNTVTDVLSGVTLNLAKVGSATLTISYDTQKAKDAIKAFVDQYNSVMNFIAGKMGDKGDLQGDPTLMRIKQDLWAKITDQLSNVPPGGHGCLAAIGISTSDSSSPLNFNSAGALSIDDAKLSKALVENPTAVYQLFSGDDKKGLIQAVSSYLDLLLRSTDGVIPAKQNGLDRILKDMDDQSQRLQDRLTQVEQRYRRQFVALEQALASLQSQGNWLAGQIARMTPPAPGGV